MNHDLLKALNPGTAPVIICSCIETARSISAAVLPKEWDGTPIIVADPSDIEVIQSEALRALEDIRYGYTQPAERAREALNKIRGLK